MFCSARASLPCCPKCQDKRPTPLIIKMPKHANRRRKIQLPWRRPCQPCDPLGGMPNGTPPRLPGCCGPGEPRPSLYVALHRVEKAMPATDSTMMRRCSSVLLFSLGSPVNPYEGRRVGTLPALYSIDHLTGRCQSFRHGPSRLAGDVIPADPARPVPSRRAPYQLSCPQMELPIHSVTADSSVGDGL